MRYLFASAAVAALMVAAPAAAVTFETLYSFSGTNGGLPYASLIVNSNGTLFGTTSSGGSQDMGTAFSYDPGSDTHTVLHSFAGRPDGAYPYGALAADTEGNLYGTTASGGTSNFGAVFRIGSDASYSTIHSFNNANGAQPIAGLVADSLGNFYGTTNGGGSGYGTLFKIGTDGSHQLLHSFDMWNGGGSTGSLAIDSAGNLYGATSQTTYAGGSGLIFKFGTDGIYSILHTFSGTDGAMPFYGGLVIDDAGTVYGTTDRGTGDAGYGTVFKITADGIFSTLHKFDWADGDGRQPNGKLIVDAAGNLFGTTTLGGSTDLGTIFRIDAEGTFTNLHTIPWNSPTYPMGGLVADAEGNLYGTTLRGGPNNSGYGTIFKLSDVGYVLPSIQPPVGGVPEPATWAMLIAGFGIVGAAARRREAVMS